MYFFKDTSGVSAAGGVQFALFEWLDDVAK